MTWKGAVALLCMLFAACPLAAEPVSLSGPLVQGGMVVGKAAPGTRVRLGDRPLRVSEDGTFVFGIHRDDTGTVDLHLIAPDGTTTKRTEPIKIRTYNIQRIDGLPPKQVSPPEEVLARIRREAAAVRAVRQRNSAFVHFTDTFLWPVKGTVTGIYGSQRILNGTPRQPHYGVDIAAPAGTPVLAPAAGIVSFVGDLYYSGGTLVIDHGHGVASAFLHMDRINVVDGETVARGAVIGTVGSSGRSTGAHLDWRVNWFDKRLDPELLRIVGR